MGCYNTTKFEAKIDKTDTPISEITCFTIYTRMSDTEVTEEEKRDTKSDGKSDDKLAEQVRPHHTINQELDIGTPVYQR